MKLVINTNSRYPVHSTYPTAFILNLASIFNINENSINIYFQTAKLIKKHKNIFFTAVYETMLSLIYSSSLPSFGDIGKFCRCYVLHVIIFIFIISILTFAIITLQYIISNDTMQKLYKCAICKVAGIIRRMYKFPDEYIFF